MPIPECAYCGEVLFGNERNPNTPLLDMHAACGFRSIIGSLAHLQGRCGCYVAGSGAHDPPGLSRRAAAEAAFEYWLGLTEEGQKACIYRPRLSDLLQ